MGNNRKNAVRLDSDHSVVIDKTTSTLQTPMPNMSSNAQTLLSEEHANLSAMAVVLTEMTANSTYSSRRCIKKLVKFTMELVRGSELDGTVTAVRLLELWVLATPTIPAAPTNRVAGFYRQIASELVMCLLEPVVEKLPSFNVRTRTWTNKLCTQGSRGEVFVDQSLTRTGTNKAGTKAVVNRSEASVGGKVSRKRISLPTWTETT